MRCSVGLALLLAGAAPLCAQSDATAPSAPMIPTITTQSTLVTVPALVRNKSGAILYTFKVEDFHLTDDGVEQKLHLEEDTDGQPLALVVLIENGSDGASKLEEYDRLPTLVDNFAGAVPHRIAVVTFDSTPAVVQKFTEDGDAVSHALKNIESGDSEAAILDALDFSVKMLARQPPNYRRAILLLSETVDHGSHTSLEQAVRAVSDTNTTIYAVSFTSTRSNLKRDSAKSIAGSDQPGPQHGCFSRDPNDPNVNLQEKRVEQWWDCTSELLPPLALAKALFIAVMNSMSKNVPETVTRMTGGEYFVFHNQKGLEQELITLANHVPNRYVLSFQPHSPHPGPHAIRLTLPDYEKLQINARETYWAEGPAQAAVK